MSRIRTPSQFTDTLDNEVAWRIKELADVKILARTSVYPLKKSIIRAGIALAYAHWEGFVKASVDHYLNFVGNQNVKVKEVTPCLLALSKKRHFNDFAQSKKFRTYSRLIEELTETPFIDQKVTFPSSVRTANLKSDVFIDISESIGISLTPYEERFKFIDIRLVKRRNEIAHGSYLDIDEDSFKELVDDVITLLRTFKKDLLHLVATQQYRRTRPKADEI